MFNKFHKKIIGGEHPLNPWTFLSKSKHSFNNIVKDFKNNFNVEITFGAYYSLLAIIDDLKKRNGSDFCVLLPSFLCPSMLIPFKKRNVTYKFYKIDENLFINEEDILSRLDQKVRAILFIDYFGKNQISEKTNLLRIIHEKEIKIIQDSVQCINFNTEDIYGDYAYNSFRKFLPIEGSLLVTKHKLDINLSKPSKKYRFYKRIGLILRHYHLKYGIFRSSLFLNLFLKAERYYYSDKIWKMPKLNRIFLNKIDFEAFAGNQKKFFSILFREYSAIMPKLLQTNDYTPYGFVVKIPHRDLTRNNLISQNVFPPIHWIQSPEINETMFPESIALSKQILTIPLLRMNEHKLEYLISQLKKHIKNESIS